MAGESGRNLRVSERNAGRISEQSGPFPAGLFHTDAWPTCGVTAIGGRQQTNEWKHQVLMYSGINLLRDLVTVGIRFAWPAELRKGSHCAILRCRPDLSSAYYKGQQCKNLACHSPQACVCDARVSNRYQCSHIHLFIFSFFNQRSTHRLGLS